MGNIYDVVKLLGDIVKEQKGAPSTQGTAVYRDENGKETTILEFHSSKELEEGKSELITWLTEHDVYPTSVTARIVPAPADIATEDKPKKYPSLGLQSNPEKLTDIAKWLNKQDYTQSYGRKQERTRTKFTDKKLSDLFKESIYCGFLQYGVAKPVDLVEAIGFEAMITADEFLKLNNLDSLDRIVTRGIATKSGSVNLLQGRIICGHCQSKMHFNTGTGKMKKTYVYFRCDNPECSFKLTNPSHTKHSIRANIVTTAAIKTLEEAQFDLAKAYAEYAEQQKLAVESESIDLLSQERRARANIQHTEADLERAKIVIADPEKADIAKYYKKDIKKYVELDLPRYQRELAEIKRKQGEVKDSLLSEEKFLKLIKNSINYLSKLDNLEQINNILEKFYSNFVILDKSVSVVTFNQEWYDVLNPEWLGMGFALGTPPS